MTKFRELFHLYTVIFLGFFGFALTLTLFIPMLMNKSVDFLPAGTSVSWRAFLSGLLLAMYPLGQFFGSPVIGNLSDHYGRKKVLLISLVACAIGFVAIALSIELHQVIMLFISAFLTGLCESNMAISQSIIADRTEDPKQKAKLIGYAYSACSLGYIVGPLVGGLGGSFISFSAPFWITAFGVIGLITWVATTFKDEFIPDSHRPINFLKSLTAIKSIFENKKLRKFYLVNFLIFFAVQGLYRVVPLYVVDKWQPTLHFYSLLIAFVSFVCFITNLFILGPLASRISTKRFLSGLLIAGGLFVLLIIIPNDFNWIWFTFGITVIPTVMALPTCTTWLSEQVSSTEQGQVLGNNQALLVLGESTSAAIGGLIAAVYVPLPIIITAIILVGTGLIINFKFK